MTDEGNDKDKLLNDAIKASIDFEELMDQTDFDSWLDTDSPETLKKGGQLVGPFINYKNNEKKLKEIWYLFSSDIVPGKINKRLVSFLRDDLAIDWAENAECEWKSDDNKTIRIFKGGNSAEIEIDEKKEKATLKISDGRTHNLKVKKENGKLNIYEIYYQMKREVINNSSNSVVNSSLEEDPISKLFDAKIKRLEARICSNKEDEKKGYIEVLRTLLSALNALHNLEGDNKDTRWFVLLYNDLSICYAGLDNSSMSRGYAEEARKIIEKEFEKYYKEFDKKLSANNSKNLKDIEGLDFVSSKLYDLYTVALFNQALAERRSYLYTDAERNFKRLIKYAEKSSSLENFNYYSALLNLSDLYLDLGRSKEAIELLGKIKKSDKDIRYWKASITEINALIDQSDYDNAEKKLKKKFSEEKNYFSLVERHRITSNGFKALNCYARREIEKVKNTLGNNLFCLDSEYKKYLNPEYISELRNAFKDNDCPISGNAKINKIDNKNWKLRDGDRIYIIEDTGKHLNINDKSKLEEVKNELEKKN